MDDQPRSDEPRNAHEATPETDADRQARRAEARARVEHERARNEGWVTQNTRLIGVGALAVTLAFAGGTALAGGDEGSASPEVDLDQAAPSEPDRRGDEPGLLDGWFDEDADEGSHDEDSHGERGESGEDADEDGGSWWGGSDAPGDGGSGGGDESDETSGGS
jgi:hypothetical protein